MYVDAPRELRVARAAARGWTEEDFARREANQESLETKRKLADVVIDNSGSPESAQAQIEHFWRSLGGCPPR
jgi:dephospho-CoA kinase